MKKASIFYFSGTGNTWWAALRLAEHLKIRGIGAKAVSIEKPGADLKRHLSGADLVFLMYPIYGSDRPEIMKDFITRLPPASLPLGIICTQMLYSGDGAWLDHNLIEDKGYKIKWAQHLRMPNNISIPGFPFRYTNNRETLDAQLQRADKKLIKTAAAVADGRTMLQGTTYFSFLLGILQRGPYRRMLPSFRTAVNINPERCTKCGRCIDICPAGNITFADEKHGGFPEFQDSCNLCLRCYNFCPEQAVQYQSKPFKPKSGGRELPYQGPTDDFSPYLLK